MTNAAHAPSDAAGGTICVFAKPPRPGSVKTRLLRALGADAAAGLAAAFVRDTWASLASVDWANRVLATTDDARADWSFIEGGEIWLQGEGDLGARIEHILGRALRSAPFAIAVGADTPGLPVALLERARVALRESDAVLGPCDDGGFFLIGLRRCPPGVLAGLPWSSETTFASTRARLQDFGLTTSILPSWFDVDRLQDLERLRSLLDANQISAPVTAAWLARHAKAAPAP